MLDIRVPVYCHPSTPILTEIDCSLLENQMEFSLYENYIHHNFGKLNFNTFTSLIIVSSLINDNIIQFIVERNIFSQPGITILQIGNPSRSNRSSEAFLKFF